ncbi:MAG: T9SS type A sorting domain-containing protein, partial [Dolichospermum sp.]
YAQFQAWNGTSWDRWNGTAYQAGDVNANPTGTEVKGTFNANDSGFIEVRVPKAAISGSPLTGDVQFIIGGNLSGDANGHGIFDAIPNESNGTSWNAPGNATIATGYINSVPLPIKLNTFNGSLSNNKVLLNWQTASEGNLDGFEIEKQENNSWRKLGFVNATNQANGSSYNFSDATVLATNIYRIKSVTLTGNIVYSQVITVRGAKSSGTQVFPTLISNNNLNIRTIEDKAGKTTVKVVDMLGKIVQQTNLITNAGDVTQSFSLTNLKAGMYFVEVTTPSNKTITKVVVQ